MVAHSVDTKAVSMAADLALYWADKKVASLVVSMEALSVVRKVDLTAAW